MNKTTSVSLLDAEPQQKLDQKPIPVTRNRLNRPLVSHLKSKNLKEPYQLSETFQSSFYQDEVSFIQKQVLKKNEDHKIENENYDGCFNVSMKN